MGRQQFIQTYPPEDWVCPGCGKEHSKPHFAHEGQIDRGKKPGEPGRILFNRRKKDDSLDHSMEVRDGLPDEAPAYDEEGNPRDLTCPHCGYTTDATVLIRVRELPSKIDRFFQEEGIDPKKSWRKLLNDFVNWLKKREDGI